MHIFLFIVIHIIGYIYLIGGLMVGIMAANMNESPFYNYSWKKFAADILCGPAWWFMIVFVGFCCGLTNIISNLKN